jgi:hypothetical protein
MRQAASSGVRGLGPGVVAVGSATDETEPEATASATRAVAQGLDPLLGQIARVNSTRDGRLVVTLRTIEGEIKLHGASWMQVLDAEGALPPGDLWDHIGSGAVITCGWEDARQVIQSIAIE